MSSLASNDHRFNQGVEDLESENYQAASSAFKQWLNKNPDDVDALYNLGVAEYYLENIEQVIKAWSRALEIEPQNNDLLQAILDSR